MRVFHLLLLLAVMTNVPGSAQSDNELLQGILCEIRELRSTFLQSQATTPLLDANRREREFAARRLDIAVERQRETQERLQTINTRMDEVSQRLRDLQRNDRSNIPQEERQTVMTSLQNERKELSQLIPQVQDDLHRAAGEASALSGRISEFEIQYERLQAQMRSLASASGSVCETPPVRLHHPGADVSTNRILRL